MTSPVEHLPTGDDRVIRRAAKSGVSRAGVGDLVLVHVLFDTVPGWVLALVSDIDDEGFVMGVMPDKHGRVRLDRITARPEYFVIERRFLRPAGFALLFESFTDLEAARVALGPFKAGDAEGAP